MKSCQSKFYFLILAVFALALCLGSTSQAATITKANNGTSLDSGSSWVGGNAPGGSDIAQWDSTVTNANTIGIGNKNLSWLGIKILDPGGLVAINVGNGSHDTITLGPSGINMTGATADLTLTTKLILGGVNIWDVANGRTLSAINTVADGGFLLTIQGAGTTLISGVVSGAGGLAKNGSGTLTLSGANTFGGSGQTITLGAGTLNINTASALGNAANTLIISGGTIDNTSAGAITLANNYAQNWNGDFAFTGTKDLNLGAGAVTMNNHCIVTVNGGNLAEGGVIGGGFDLTKAGVGALTLSGANTFGGLGRSISLSAGTLNINNASALGNAANTFIISGGTINNTSAGAITLANNYAQNWNGDFTFAGTQDLNLGNGAVAMSATRRVTVVGRNLTIGGAISGNGSGLVKDGNGTLILGGSSANTYDGATTVNAGELDLGKTAGVGAIGSGGLTVQSGGRARLLANDQIVGTAAVTVNNGGTLDLNGHSDTVGSFVNRGTVNLGGGNLGATAGITNASGGQLFDHGSVSSFFVNAGNLTVSNGTFRTSGGFVQNGTATIASDGTLVASSNLGGWDNNGTVDLHGGVIDGDLIRNHTGGSLAGFGTVSNAVANEGVIRATGPGMTFARIVTNDGLIEISSGTMTFQSNLVIRGLYQSDPSTNNYLADVTIEAGGALQGAPGDLFNFSKSLFVQSTNSSQFDLGWSVVEFSGGGIHTNAVTGENFGTNSLPAALPWSATNFAYGTLRLDSTNDPLYVVSGDGALSHALYVNQLDLSGLTNLFTSVSNMVTSLLFAPAGINIYYANPLIQPLNNYLGDQAYQLADANGQPGGFLMPAVPEPSMVALLSLAGLLLRRRAR